MKTSESIMEKRDSPRGSTWSARMVDSVLRRYSLSGARWHYEDGLMLKAVAEAAEAKGNPNYHRFVLDWVDRLVTPKGSIRTYRLKEYNLDQIYPGRLFFPAYRQTGEERYREAIGLLREQLRRQPRTASGGFWHKQIYPNQMWLDGVYMAEPFFAEYASAFNEPADFEDVAHQIVLMEKQTRDPQTGLLYHAWDESRQQRWANPDTGCSPQFWGRGMGWFAMAVVDVMDYFPQEHTQRDVLKAILHRTAQALIRVQDDATGLWYQVLDRGGNPGNYLESSASAMFVYAFAKGVRKKLLADDYLPHARRAFRGLLENRIKMDSGGFLTLEGTCGVAGLGGKPYRDGSYEYYVGEETVVNDPKGVGSFILAALEMEAAGTSTSNPE